MSRNIVFEGWLTKSPPTKRIWRTKWRRRWFALRQGELPGQYLLDYYADRNCRRHKGTINLDLCEQVDAGLHMERSGNGTLDPKLRGSVFTIQTQSRIYHLEADCEADMEKWVDAICRVCGLRATEDTPSMLGTYQNSVSSISAMNGQYESADGTGPYIPISECITGVRAQDSQRAFTFDPRNIVTSARSPFERVADSRTHQMYMSQPQIRLNNADFSENESNLSDDECKSLNASQSNIQDWSVAKSFTKLKIITKKNGISEDEPPEPPPRPPKTFQSNTVYQGPKMHEPTDQLEPTYGQTPWLRQPRRLSQGAAPPSPGRANHPSPANLRITDDEEEYSPGVPSMPYFNLPPLPPAVDRALKPRRSSHSIYSIINNYRGNTMQGNQYDDGKNDALQYLDLDLQMSIPAPSKPREVVRQKEIAHGKSLSAIDAGSAYKTVDFLKTEAFNITRQDAEASRSNQH